MPSKLTPATIKAMTAFVRALDKHRLGAVMLILVILAGGVAAALPHLPVRWPAQELFSPSMSIGVDASPDRN